jgi:hypothetical protein
MCIDATRRLAVEKYVCKNEYTAGYLTTIQNKIILNHRKQPWTSQQKSWGCRRFANESVPFPKQSYRYQKKRALGDDAPLLGPVGVAGTSKSRRQPPGPTLRASFKFDTIVRRRRAVDVGAANCSGLLVDTHVTGHG